LGVGGRDFSIRSGQAGACPQRSFFDLISVFQIFGVSESSCLVTYIKPHSVHRLPQPKQLLGTALQYVNRSVLLRLLVFLAALWAVWNWGKPWHLGWLRMDEAQGIAESFLVKQGADLQHYTLIRAVERRAEGTWAAREKHAVRFGVDPAVGYLMRFFRKGTLDGWTIAVAPSGQIYRVQREQLDDEPGARLSYVPAYNLAVEKLATDLGIPSYKLSPLSDTLVFMPQRNDWTFAFSWPEVLDSGGAVRVTLAGETVTGLSFDTPSSPLQTLPHRTSRSSRLLGFALILGGVFLMMHYHRTPLALRSAGLWGGLVFLLTLASRGLTFTQSVILMPPDDSLTGFLSRVGLSAVIEALQTGLLMGLIVATGEALSRDVFRGSTTLSRLAPGLKDWRAAWAQAARWAFPAAAVVMVYEAAAMHYLGPVGLCGKVPTFIANAFSSPAPGFALPVQIALDTVWEECLWRMWLLTLFLFWLRLPVLAIPLSACAAAYFAGYDINQFLTIGGLFYIAWGLVAGWLMLRVGIIGAMLFHFLVLGSYAGLVLVWTGFGDHFGIALLTGMVMLVMIVAWDRVQPKPAQLESLPTNP